MAQVFVPKTTHDADTLTVTDDDILIFAEGGQHFEENLDAFEEDNLGGIQVHRRFTGRIGGDGAGFLKTGVSGSGREVVYAASGGHFYLHPLGADGESPVGVTRVQNIGAGLLVLGGGGSVDMLSLSSGMTRVRNEVQVDDIDMDGGDLRVYQHSAEPLDKVNISGGTARLDRDCDGELNISGNAHVDVGRVDTTATSPPNYTGATILVTGGRLKFRGRGTVTKVRVEGDGGIDLSEVPVAMTITLLQITEKARKRSNLKSRYVTITKTAEATTIGHDVGAGD